MHRTFLFSLATAATGALAGPLRREASTTQYACNPAHQYPEGVQCVSTAGSLALVTPTSSAAATTYACNPAHSYPNGASCISTQGSLTLITPASSAAATTYACNPAHSYPNGASCISTQGSLTLVTPTSSAAATTYACNPAHSYPNGASCISTQGSLTLVTPASSAVATTTAASIPSSASIKASKSACSAVKAVATAAATSGETKADGLTWTVENLSRYCAEDKSGCDYNFNLTASDNRPVQSCTIVRLDVKNAPTESWSDLPCTAGSPINVSWGYSAQFGVENAFAVMTVVNTQEKAKSYFGVANVDGQKVTAGNPFGSFQIDAIGPQPVYLY
jgi:hypothetical protein